MTMRHLQLITLLIATALTTSCTQKGISGKFYVNCPEKGNDLVSLLQNEGAKIKEYSSVEETLEEAALGRVSPDEMTQMLKSALAKIIAKYYPSAPNTWGCDSEQ